MIETLWVALSVLGCVLVLRSLWSGFHPVWFTISGLFALVCGAFAQTALEKHPAFATFLAWADRAGHVILAIGIVTLVAGVGYGTTYTILRGRKGGSLWT